MNVVVRVVAAQIIHKAAKKTLWRNKTLGDPRDGLMRLTIKAEVG